MNSVRFYLIKNKELILYIISFAAHAVFAPVYKYYGFNFLFIYSLIAAAVYGSFLILFNKSLRSFFRDFTFFEVLVFSILVTVTTGTDFGLMIYSICVIPALFFFVYNSKSSLAYHVILSIIAALIVIFEIWWQFLRPRSIFSGFITAVTMYKTFYRFHTVITSMVAIFFILYLCIITENALVRNTLKSKKRGEELNFMANHDQLTNLYNRRKITSYCSILVSKKEKENIDYALCIFDIDNFKKVNDTYGHDAGDFVLVKISSLVKDLMPKNARIARWGGEEFLLTFNKCDSSILPTLEMIRKAVESEENIYNDTNIPITLTFGIASSKSGDNLDKIIMNADNLLFYGKQHGKNQICADSYLKELCKGNF